MARKPSAEALREAKELSLADGEDMKVVWNREQHRWEVFPAWREIRGGTGGGFRWPWEKAPEGLDLTAEGFYDLPAAIVRAGRVTLIL